MHKCHWRPGGVVPRLVYLFATPSARAAMRTVLWGVVWCAGACWFWWYMVGGNPLHELALIRHAETTPGLIVEASECVDYDDRGRALWDYKATYTYRVPDGREFTRTVDGPGRLSKKFRDLHQPQRVEVEYLPDDPGVSQLTGSGCGSVLEWVLRRALVGSLFLAMLLSPGLALIRLGAVDLRKSPAIDLVKSRLRDIWLDEHPWWDPSGRWRRAAERDDWGWRTYRQAGGPYIVTHRAGLRTPQPVTVLAWEVDLDSKAVRSISGDSELAQRYGFEPLPPSKPPAPPAAPLADTD